MAEKVGSSRAGESSARQRFLVVGVALVALFTWAGIRAANASLVEKIEPNAIYNNIRSGRTVVMFGAEWCGWCKRQEPGLARVSRERMEVRFLEVEANTPRAAQRFMEDFGVNAYPTLVVFRDGVETGRHVGYLPSGSLDAFLTGSLARGGRSR